MTAVGIRLGPTDHGRRMTLEEFAHAEGAPGYRFELGRGVIEVVEVPGLPHGDMLQELDDEVRDWRKAHLGVVRLQASGDRCALRLPGMQSERHPDCAIYLTQPPDRVNPWDLWVPDIVVEVVSKESEKPDYEVKRAEYLAAGVREYWIIDPARGGMLVLRRRGDRFDESEVKTTYQTSLLPSLTLDVAAILAAGGA